MKERYGENIIVTLTSSSKPTIINNKNTQEENDAKLMKYYSKLGFKEIEMIPGFMYADINSIIEKCTSYKGGRINISKRKRNGRRSRH